jgi:hypothetical protein
MKYIVAPLGAPLPYLQQPTLLAGKFYRIFCAFPAVARSAETLQVARMVRSAPRQRDDMIDREFAPPFALGAAAFLTFDDRCDVGFCEAAVSPAFAGATGGIASSPILGISGVPSSIAGSHLLSVGSIV